MSAGQPLSGSLDRLARSPDPARRLGSALIWALMVGAVVCSDVERDETFLPSPHDGEQGACESARGRARRNEG